MPTFETFNLPDAGEGLTEADIVTWRVAVGDTVEVNQPLVEIETAKSLVEIPCPYDGVVADLLVTEGSTVEVGAPILVVDIDPNGAPAATPSAPAAATPTPSPAPPIDAPAPAPSLPTYGAAAAAEAQAAPAPAASESGA